MSNLNPAWSPAVARLVLDSGDGNPPVLPSYAWPGGYPIVYLDWDLESICPDCANKADWSDARIVDWYIHYEGPPAQCANCNKLIDSAYGDPDNPA